jgi:transcriptional antiterminator NusG
MAKHWYVLHTLTGHESKIKSYIENYRDQESLQEKIGEVLLPTQEVVSIKKGKKVKQTKKFFSSYLLLEMELDKDVQHAITAIPGVTNFVGTAKGKPLPLREDEVARILGQAEKGKGKEVSDIPFNISDAVKIKEGPFKDFTGVVEELQPEKGKMKVMVSVFGRSTPVELDFVQVIPIS